MRPVIEWDINDVESLIKNQVQENLNLDYKRSISLENNEKNKNEISKDVSELQGKTVQLMFRMRRTKLYSMQFINK